MASAKTHRNFYHTICTETHQHFKKTLVKKRVAEGATLFGSCVFATFLVMCFPAGSIELGMHQNAPEYAPKRTCVVYCRCGGGVCVCVYVCVVCVIVCVYLCVCALAECNDS